MTIADNVSLAVRLREAARNHRYITGFALAGMLNDAAAWVESQEFILKAVEMQATDAGLWFEAKTAPEAYLQQELRRLHMLLEADPMAGDAANARLSVAAERDLLRTTLEAIYANDMEYIRINNLSGAENNHILRQAREVLAQVRTP